MTNKNTKFRILIVDDNPKNIQLVASILKGEGYEMAFAMDGEAAINILENKYFDLILMDIMMPGMDGYRVCEQIKKMDKHKDVPIIFLTAKTDNPSLVKAFQAGAVDYITKPFQQSELLVRIKNHLKLQEAYSDIRQAHRQLEELNATKDRIFAIIGHDLRTPIGNLKNLFDLFSEEVNHLGNEYLITLMQLGKETVEVSLILLENLMAWAKSQNGELNFSPDFQNINEVVDENMKLFSIFAQSKDIDLQTHTNNNTIAFFDKNMITTVIRNLLSNAVKFTKQGGTVSLKVTDTDNAYEIEIRDSGVGIPPHKLETLFDKDQYYSSYGTNNEKGAGLGLKLCYDFIEAHGTKLNVESEQEKGSTFMFALPKKSNL